MRDSFCSLNSPANRVNIDEEHQNLDFRWLNGYTYPTFTLVLQEVTELLPVFWIMGTVVALGCILSLGYSLPVYDNDVWCGFIFKTSKLH